MKIGIVGAGGIARYHYDGFVKAGAQVAAIADMNEKAARSFADSRGIKNVYPSLAEMLKGETLDGVSVVTPNKFHKPLVVEALAAGKHVFCEKPPALNAAEMREMIAAREKSGATLLFDFNNRARSESRALMDYITAGRVGRINSAQALWIRRAGIPGFGGWFTSKAISGGGPVIDLLHMTDLALHFLGYPEPASLLAATFDAFMDNKAFKGPWGIPDGAGKADVESSCHAFLTFKTGQCLFIRSSWAELNEREVVQAAFQGEKMGGKIERVFGVDGLDETSVDSCALFTCEYGRQVDLTIKSIPDETMGRVAAAANFVEASEGKAAPLNTPREALILMQIIDAMYESARTGKAVSL